MSRALAGQLDVNSLALWYQSVALLRAAVAGWQSKGSKHMAVTLPLQTQLLCLDSDSAFLHGINSLVDNLSKQLRVCGRLEVKHQLKPQLPSKPVLRRNPTPHLVPLQDDAAGSHRRFIRLQLDRNVHLKTCRATSQGCCIR